MMKTLHVIVYGQVQGVNFRRFVKEKALQLHLTGWIKNNTDGTVEAVFEGEKVQLQEILVFCKRGIPRANVEKVKGEWGDILTGFKEFKVVY